MKHVRTIELDYVYEGTDLRADIASEQDKYPQATITVIEENGPNGWPTVEASGDERTVKRILREWGYAIEMTPGARTSVRYKDLLATI